jgi:type I restriction enzyme S subunit
MARFTEVFDDVTKQGRKIPTSEYLEDGLYPIIDQGQSKIAGYTNEHEGLFTSVPAIIFGDHTRVLKYVDVPCFLGADGVKLLRAKIPNANYKYLFYALSSADIPNTGYNRHFKWLKEVNIPLPSNEEQLYISSVMDKISGLIDLRNQQLTKLDELVKARFVEMYGDVIHNDKQWAFRTFSEITTSRLGKMLDAKQQTGRFPFPYLANFNVQWFRFDLSNLNQMDFDEADQVEFKLEDGDLLVCEGGEIGRCAVWHNEIQPCYFQKALHRVRCNQNVISPDYLAWWFKYNCEHNGFAAIEGAKATIAHLPGVKLKALQVAVPPIDLQQQFASFVAQVDKSKLTIQQGLDKLELLKKALMQEYFG